MYDHLECFVVNHKFPISIGIRFSKLILAFFSLQKKYRQQPSAFKHTSVTDSPDIVHAKLSGQITNEVRRRANPLFIQLAQTSHVCVLSSSVCTKKKG